MANALDGVALNQQILVVDQSTKQFSALTGQNVNGSEALNVAIVAGGGGVAPSTSAVQNMVAASAASVLLLAANASRKDATFYNDQSVNGTIQGASSLYLSMGSAASGTNFSFRVPPNSTFTLPVDFTGAIYGYWDNGNTGRCAATDFS